MANKGPEDLIAELTIPLYIRQYIKSNSTRANYYLRGSKQKVPEKYKNSNYEYRPFKATVKGVKGNKFMLVEIASGERVIANPHLVGKVNIKNINGQDIYNGVVSKHDRNNLIGQIKKQFKQFLCDLKPINKYPLRIDVYFFDTIIDDEFGGGMDWDVDNRAFPYCKALSDLLKQEGKIEDDNRYFITEPPHPIFVPVDDVQDRQLVIRIYQDTRLIIKNNYLYGKKHNWDK